MSVKAIQAKLADLSRLLENSVAAGDTEAVTANHVEYQAALQQLIALYPKQVSKNELIIYLKNYQQQQQSLIAVLLEQKAQLQKTLKGTKQIRRYIIS
jgi:hypothetical protein